MYHTSPTCPAVKRTQPDNEHQSSIIDRHQHKQRGITDSPKEEEIPYSGNTRTWLPLRQAPDETLPEFRA